MYRLITTTTKKLTKKKISTVDMTSGNIIPEKLDLAQLWPLDNTVKV